MNGEIRKKTKEIKNFLINKDASNLNKFIKSSHPADLAEIFNFLKKEERKELLSFLSFEEAANVLPKIEPVFLKELLDDIENVRLSQILEIMPPDEAADILGDLQKNRKKQILNLIKKEEADDVNLLLKYKEDTAGGIMTSDFFSLYSGMTVTEAIEKLRIVDISNISYIYVVTDNNNFVGVLPLRNLITADSFVKIGEIANKNTVRVTVDVDQEEVANLVKKYDLRAIPVVDNTNKLVGIVTVDDILDIVTEEASEDIYRMAGIKEDESLLHRSIPVAVRFRLPWLIACLMGGMVAAGIVGVFEETLTAVIILAAFVPVIMGMGGNIGTQSATIIVRGLATGSINIKDAWHLLWRELRIGLLIGIICGFAIGIIAQIWQGSPELGIVVGTSMTATVTIAAFLGAFFPIFFQRLGIDPAIVSGPVITTAKDITALLIYFGIATLIML